MYGWKLSANTRPFAKWLNLGPRNERRYWSQEYYYSDLVQQLIYVIVWNQLDVIHPLWSGSIPESLGFGTTMSTFRDYSSFISFIMVE